MKVPFWFHTKDRDFRSRVFFELDKDPELGFWNVGDYRTDFDRSKFKRFGDNWVYDTNRIGQIEEAGST